MVNPFSTETQFSRHNFQDLLLLILLALADLLPVSVRKGKRERLMVITTNFPSSFLTVDFYSFIMPGCSPSVANFFN